MRFMLNIKSQWEISAEEGAIKALEAMIREDAGRLVVVKGDGIAGLITRNGIARYMQIRGDNAARRLPERSES